MTRRGWNFVKSILKPDHVYQKSPVKEWKRNDTDVVNSEKACKMLVRKMLAVKNKSCHEWNWVIIEIEWTNHLDKMAKSDKVNIFETGLSGRVTKIIWGEKDG